jgi:hypothetical protein
MLPLPPQSHLLITSILYTVKMKQILLYMMIVLCFACREDNLNKTQSLIDKIENIGIDKFERIEYFIRGNKENYTYYFTDSTSYVWTYLRDTREFDLNTHPNYINFKDQVINPDEFATNLRNQVLSLHIQSISQAPWIGKVIRFWISRSMIVEYVNPKFEFNSAPRKIWQKEALSGRKLKENWYLITIKYSGKNSLKRAPNRQA